MAWKHPKGPNANHHRGHKNTGKAGKSWGHYDRRGKKHAHKGWHGKRKSGGHHKKGYHYHLKHKRHSSHHRHVTHHKHRRHLTHKAHHKRTIHHAHPVHHHHRRHSGTAVGATKAGGLSALGGIIRSVQPPSGATVAKTRTGHVKARTLHRKTISPRRAVVATGGVQSKSLRVPHRHIHSILHRLHRRHHHVLIRHTIHHRQKRVQIVRIRNVVYRKR